MEGRVCCFTLLPFGAPACYIYTIKQELYRPLRMMGKDVRSGVNLGQVHRHSGWRALMVMALRQALELGPLMARNQYATFHGIHESHEG